MSDSFLGRVDAWLAHADENEMRSSLFGAADNLGIVAADFEGLYESAQIIADRLTGAISKPFTDDDVVARRGQAAVATTSA